MDSAEKPGITEQAAARHFVMDFVENVEKNWPSIHSTLTCLPGAERLFDHVSGEWVQFEFAFASIALEMQALPNLLASDQAQRVRDHVMGRLGTTPDIGDLAVEAIKVYELAWKNALAKLEPPFGEVASAFYDRLGLVYQPDPTLWEDYRRRRQ